MTTIVSAEDVHWSWTPKDPNFVPSTIQQLLAEQFEGEPDFYLCERAPMVVWGMWDYAEDWSTHPIREVHPFHPIVHGQQISEAEFRNVVRVMHGLDGG